MTALSKSLKVGFYIISIDLNCLADLYIQKKNKKKLRVINVRFYIYIDSFD